MWAGIFLTSEEGNFGISIIENDNDNATASLYGEKNKKLENPPKEVKAIYSTTWTAITENGINRLIDLIGKTEVNAIVIDIKDYTGKVSFNTNSLIINSIESENGRISNLINLINRLHNKNIYAIARVAIFQDLFLAEKRPDLAVQSKRAIDDGKDKNSVDIIWRDKKDLAWVDPASQEVWNYTISIAKELDRVGFDEINFDYIRFPSDGDMKDVSYPFYDEKKPRQEILKNFFKYLSDNLRPLGIRISVDLFGLAAINKDDLGIGQVLETAIPYFDFVCPMVYPSHYAKGFLGFNNPAEYPYEVVKYSLRTAQGRIDDFKKKNPDINLAKIRPWLQDFDLGATYDEKMIRLQKKAVYDVGLDAGWFLWDPKNQYTIRALDK